MNPVDRAAALGYELIRVHDWLRDTLANLIDGLDEFSPDEYGPLHTQQLLAHCIGFCTALSAHHTGEDAVAFPILAAQIPELAPLLVELAHDHELIAGVIVRVDTAASSLSEVSSADEVARVRGELEGLAAVMESHFSWEERRILTALNSLTGGYSTAELFGVAPPL